MIEHTLPQTELSVAERHAMYDLLQRYFSGVSIEGFNADLNEKDWVIRFYNERRELSGFTTIQHYRANYGNEKLSVIYSGDTIIAPSAWGSMTLPKAWIKAVRKITPCHDKERLLWLLICSGFRTYRFLPLFWRVFYPCYQRPTPDPEQALLDFLARQKFGDQYDKKQGLVRFRQAQALQPKLAKIPPDRQQNPHIAHFNRLNPHAALGDELVCVTDLSDENLTRAGRRMLYPDNSHARPMAK